jgi:hypothetical protein
MPWDVNAPELQAGCRHGDGTNEQITVRIPTFPHRCVGNHGPSRWVFDATLPRDRARCETCNVETAATGYRDVIDPTSGTMRIVQVMPGPGMSAFIYQCAICGGRYSNATNFGAQGDSFYCGTAGNHWR